MSTIFPSLKVITAERSNRLGILWRGDNLPEECKSVLTTFEIYKSHSEMLKIMCDYIAERGGSFCNGLTMNEIFMNSYAHDPSLLLKLKFLSEPIEETEAGVQKHEIIEQLERGERDFNKLMIAACEGDPDGFEYYFLSNRNSFFNSLDAALEMGKIDPIIDRIIKVNVNVTDDKGNTALMWAVKKGNLDLVKKLIKAKADVNAFNDNGFTPLLIFCAEYYKDITPKLYAILYELLDAGANINACDHERITPLMHTVQKGCLGFLGILIDNGALINAKDNNGRTALYYAVNRWIGVYHDNRKEIIRALRKAGIDCNIADHDGLTAKDFAISLNEPYLAEEL